MITIFLNKSPNAGPASATLRVTFYAEQIQVAIRASQQLSK